MLSDICSDFLRINEDIDDDIAECPWPGKAALILDTIQRLHDSAEGYDWARYGIEREAVVAASAAALAQPDLFLDMLKELAARVRTFHDLFEVSKEREADMEAFAREVLQRRDNA